MESNVETKPLGKLAQIAVRELNKNFAAQLNEVLTVAAEADGVSAEDGWRFDAQQGAWARQVPVAAE